MFIVIWIYLMGYIVEIAKIFTHHQHVGPNEKDHPLSNMKRKKQKSFPPKLLQ